MTELTAFSEYSSAANAALAFGAAKLERTGQHIATPIDTRFRDLLGHAAWSTLPFVVRERFSHALAPGQARVFAGTVTETRLSRVGRVLATVARIAGGPLPFTDGATGPSTVVVTERPELGGQIWTRTYARPGGFPQTINSVKRFAGPTGLEEYLGFGLVMRLTVAAEPAPIVHRDLGLTPSETAPDAQWASEGASKTALVFRSAGYDLLLGPLRIALPRFLSPGRCTITHRAHGAERFSFTLALDHPIAGRLATQVAYFKEITP